MSRLGTEDEITITQPENLSGRVSSQSPQSEKSLSASFSAIIASFGGKNSKVAAIILVSATLITIARLLAPFEIEKDQALQLEASIRLAEGAGLTSTSVEQTSFDLTEPAKPEYLTWFPPAFSLIVAGFLYLGVPLLLPLKIIYGLMTLVGWMGWAVISSNLLSMPLRIRGRDFNLHYAIAAVSPLLLTPPWQGTDIFLWAGIPIFVLLLLKGAKGPTSYRYIIAASLLFGLLISFRYASFFLGIAGFLILAQTSWPSPSLFLKRLSVFLAPTLLIVLSVVIYINLFGSPGAVAPEYIDPASNATRIPQMLIGILNGSSVTSSLVIGSPMLARLCASMNSSALRIVVGISCLLIIILLPLILMKKLPAKSERPQSDMALSLSFIPLSLIAFLVASTFMSGQALFGVPRYYWPASLCIVFILYEISSKRASGWVVKAASNAIILAFLLYVFAYVPALGLLPRKQSEFVEQVLGFTPSKTGTVDRPSTSQELGYPSYRMFSRKENSRSKIKELYETHPDSVFLVLENYVYYIYDGFKDGGPVPGKDIRRLRGNDWKYWQQAYTSKPVKVFWVLDHISKSVKKENLSFIPESNLRTVYLDEFEKTLILESDFPADHRLFVP
jgi:hypothetical protein